MDVKELNFEQLEVTCAIGGAYPRPNISLSSSVGPVTSAVDQRSEQDSVTGIAKVTDSAILKCDVVLPGTNITYSLQEKFSRYTKQRALAVPLTSGVTIHLASSSGAITVCLILILCIS